MLGFWSPFWWQAYRRGQAAEPDGAWRPWMDGSLGLWAGDSWAVLAGEAWLRSSFAPVPLRVPNSERPMPECKRCVSCHSLSCRCLRVASLARRQLVCHLRALTGKKSQPLLFYAPRPVLALRNLEQVQACIVGRYFCSRRRAFIWSTGEPVACDSRKEKLRRVGSTRPREGFVPGLLGLPCVGW